jgi:hypothetical protein
MAECRSCRAPVDWAKDPAGKLVPVDPGERANGNLAVQEVAGVTHVRYLRKDGVLSDGERRTTSHFATCPQADKWRGRGRG